MSAAALIDALATMTQDEAAEIEMAQRRHAASIDAALSRHTDWPATIRHEILHNQARAALPAAHRRAWDGVEGALLALSADVSTSDRRALLTPIRSVARLRTALEAR